MTLSSILNSHSGMEMLVSAGLVPVLTQLLGNSQAVTNKVRGWCFDMFSLTQPTQAGLYYSRSQRSLLCWMESCMGLHRHLQPFATLEDWIPFLGGLR